MKISGDSQLAGVNGVAALAIVKVLLEILRTKQILSEGEIDIIINSAVVEVDLGDKTDISGRVIEAKQLISNLMKDSDDTTRGYRTT